MSHWKGWGTSCAGAAVVRVRQPAHGSITGDCTHGCSGPTALQGQRGDVPTELGGADGSHSHGRGVARRWVKKRWLLLREREAEGGGEIHHGANNWGFDVSVPRGAAPSSPSRWVLIVAGICSMGKDLVGL